MDVQDDLAVKVEFEMLAAEDGFYFIIKESPKFSAYRLKLKETNCDLFFMGSTMVLGVGEEPYIFNTVLPEVEKSYISGGIIRFAFRNKDNAVIPLMSIRNNVVSTLKPESIFKINILEPTIAKIANDAFTAFEEQPIEAPINKSIEKAQSYFEFSLFELEDLSLLFEVYQFTHRDIINPEQDLKMAIKGDVLKVETEEKDFFFNLTGFKDYSIRQKILAGQNVIIHFIENNEVRQEFNFKPKKKNKLIANDIS